MTKRLLSLAFAIIFAICAVPMLNIKADAAKAGYNVSASLKYANKTWNNGVGLCAEYASRCLNAGGVDVFETQVIELYNELQNGYGKAYKLTLTGGTRGKINMSDNYGKLKAVDTIFYKCNYCGDFEHVVICNGANKDGYAQDYAHNNPHNGYKTTYTYKHCGGDNWTLYSVYMYEPQKLFGAKTNLAAPKISSAYNGGNGIVVKWSSTDDAQKYRVYRKTGNGSWQRLGDTAKTSFTDKKASNQKNYTYTIRAINGKNLSQYYGGEAVKCIGTTSLKKPTISTRYIQINWNKVSSADGYSVYRKLPGGNYKKIATIKGNSRFYYRDYKVEPGVEYIYTVRAYDNSVNGCYKSSGISAIILTAPELSAVSEENIGITVNYSQVKGAEGYRIYRKTDDNKWERICDIAGGDTLSYTDTDVTEGKTYCYTVRAKNGSILGRYDAKGVSCLYEKAEETTAPEITEPSLPDETLPTIPETTVPVTEATTVSL